MACALVCSHLAAQEAEFDLTSQRSESQDVLAVPGKKLDHHGIIINPTPHKLVLNEKGKLDISKGISLKDKQKKFAEDFGFVTLDKKGVKLTIDFGAKAAAKKEVKAVSGAYALSIGEKGITITGYDERGAFYGLQTLRQLMTSPVADGGRLPMSEGRHTLLFYNNDTEYIVFDETSTSADGSVKGKYDGRMRMTACSPNISLAK